MYSIKLCLEETATTGITCTDNNGGNNVSDKPKRLIEEPAKPKSRRRKKKKLNIILRFFILIFKTVGTLILIGATTGAILACFGAVYIKTVIMPQAELDLSHFFVNENSVMYYTTPEGTTAELVTLLNTESSIWKDYHELPQNLIQATVAIEDQRFFTHPGVDWKRTGAAVLYMFTGQDIQGGSTLTQQLIKNLTEFDDVTVKRKIIEIFRALELDSNYSKEDIITWYLNRIYLGAGCYGVGSASLKYFGKDVSELTIPECASLISITNNPSVYGPYSTLITTDEETGERLTDRDRNNNRKNLVLKCMLDQNMINTTQYNQLVQEEIVFIRGEEDEEEVTLYTWYEEQVIKDVRADLIAEYGYSATAANTMISQGGLAIYTLLDTEVQAIADEVYQDWNNLKVTSANGQPLQSAISIIDNSTGDLVALVGKMGEKEENLGKNYATESYRQPGSSFKPLSAYAPALEMGLLTPASVIDDYPMSVNGSAWPKNSYGYYNGMMTLADAVARSSNATAARVVADLLTPEGSFQFLTEKFHIPLVDHMESNGSFHSDIAVAPLSLGGLTLGANTRDMAEAYAAFPNEGVYTHSRTYSKVLNRDGEVILDNTPKQEQILSASTAYYMNELLKGVVSRGTGTAAAISGMTVAGKTGTTNDNYDRWFVGYTPHYTAAVWTGYDYNESIYVSGNPALNMWKKVMQPLHSGLDNPGFPTLPGLVSVSYCRDSGLKPNSYCSSDVRGSRVASVKALAENAPQEVCTAHGSGQSVRVCLSSMAYNEEGEAVGSYQAPGPYCPAETIRSSAYIVLSRDNIGVSARDSGYVYKGGAGMSVCTVHTEEGWVDPESPEGENPEGDGNETGLPTPSEPGPTTPTPQPEEPDTSIPGTSIPGLPEPEVPAPETPEPEIPSIPTPDTSIPQPDTSTPMPDISDPSLNPDSIPGVG